MFLRKTLSPNWTSTKGLSKTVMGSIHVVTQLLFSMFPSILTFDFDLVLMSFFFLLFWALKGIFRVRYDSKTILGSTYAVKQLLFSMFPSILIFDFDLILGSILTFCGPLWAIFRVGVGFKNYFWVYSCS